MGTQKKVISFGVYRPLITKAKFYFKFSSIDVHTVYHAG